MLRCEKNGVGNSPQLRREQGIALPRPPRASYSSILWILVLLFPALHVSGSAWIPGDSQVPAPPTSGPVLLPVASHVAHDSVKFVNGDKLTGTVEAIEKGNVLFMLDLISERAEFPVENFSEISFAGPPNSPPERSDAIYVADGSYFSAEVRGLNPDAVEAKTLSGQEIAIPRDEVAGIGFYHPDDTLFENDFSSPGEMGLVPVLGGWKVEKGQFVQASPLPFCRAYVRVVQEEMMRYEWVMDVTKSRNAGLLFFASRYDTRYGQLAYMVMLRGREVYFYKVIGGRRHQGWRERVKSPGSLVRLRAEYDPRNGEIVLWSGNDILMRLFDPNPIRRGEYVLLHTEGKAAFDDLRISRLVGTIDGVAPKGDLDMVLLSNGDRVSGRVIEIFEDVVLKSPYSPIETAIDKGQVRSIAFAVPRNGVLAKGRLLPRVSLWNGDIILGRIVGLDDRSLTLKLPFIEELVIARTSLRGITFQRASSSASLPDSAAGVALSGVGVQRQNAIRKERMGKRDVEGNLP
ncbi:hypothetical protein HQ563_06000 [bacterium]|nr:hypothetical protein [bacterium]